MLQRNKVVQCVIHPCLKAQVLWMAIFGGGAETLLSQPHSGVVHVVVHTKSGGSSSEKERHMGETLPTYYLLHITPTSSAIRKGVQSGPL